jgi:hypothetical protein
MSDRKRPLLIAVLAALALLGLRGPASGGGAGEIVSVARRDFTAARLGRKGLDLLMERNGRVFLVVSPGEMAALNALRVSFDVETAKIDRSVSAGLSASGGINGAYHSTLELETDLRLLERDHPGLASVREIGETLGIPEGTVRRRLSECRRRWPAGSCASTGRRGCCTRARPD